MVGEWQTVPFGNLYAIPSRNGLTKPKRVRGEGCKFINMGEIFAFGRMQSIPCDRVPITEKELDNSLLEIGDLLFARQSLVLSGAGKCSIFLGDEEPVVFESHLIRVRPDTGIIDPEYLFYYFNSPIGRSEIWSITEQGAGQAGIRGSDLETIDVSFPGKEEQKKIVKILSALDEKIELNRQMNATLESMAQALFKSWFVDFDPVIDNALAAGNSIPDSLHARAEIRKALDDKRKPLPEALQKQFPSRFVFSEEMGWIPEGWEVKPLADFGRIICGKTPSKAKTEYFGTDIPFIKIPDMHKSMFVVEPIEFLSNLGARSQVKKMIPRGSTCVSCIATVGKVVITTKESQTNQQINSIVPKEAYLTPYLYFYMLTLEKHFHDLASGGSATLNMNTSTFSKIGLLRSGPQEIELFYTKVGSLLQKIEDNLNQITYLKNLRDTLLPKLLSGQLRIPDAEKMVADAV